MQNENYFVRKGIPEGERGEEKICLVTRFNVQFTPWNSQEKSIYKGSLSNSDELVTPNSPLTLL